MKLLLIIAYDFRNLINILPMAMTPTTHTEEGGERINSASKCIFKFNTLVYWEQDDRNVRSKKL